MKNALISFATAAGTVFVVLVLLEVIRRKTTDPVARVANILAPPTSLPSAATDVAAPAASSATSAAVS